MEDSRDFVHWLGRDMAINILLRLDNPSDLLRVSAVSSSWRHFVIANGLSKQLCLRMFPEISNCKNIIEHNYMIEPVENNLDETKEWKCLARDHRVFAFLARGLSSCMRDDCITEAIRASSTDNYPDESILNTLEPRNRGVNRGYWSSKGESDPAAPETLIYKLISNLCVITEVHVHPFLAYFQFGNPIYSAKALRFRVGHPQSSMDLQKAIIGSESTDDQGSIENKFVWTYTSPEFPMAQENRLQKFVLPEPAVCIGGILQIELLGRVQRQDMDGLYYICISHVEVVGRPLSPTFDVEIVDPSSGKCTLKYHPECSSSSNKTQEEGGETSGGQSSSSGLRSLTARLMNGGVRGWEQVILNTLLGAGLGGPGIVDDDDADVVFI